MKRTLILFALAAMAACTGAPTAPSNAAGAKAPPAVGTAIAPDAPAGLAPAPGVTLVRVGYLGNEVIYRGSDGNYYQADWWAGPGVPYSYARIVGFNVSDITPTNNTGTRDRGL